MWAYSHIRSIVGSSYCGMLFTAKEYGPVQVGALWDSDCKEPMYLVTDLSGNVRTE